MARLRWTPQALEDIEEISNYIARDSDHFARIFAYNVLQKGGQIEEFPQSGRIVPEAQQENIREIFHGNYRIIYRIIKDTVQVLTVVHGSKLIDPSQIEERL